MLSLCLCHGRLLVEFLQQAVEPAGGQTLASPLADGPKHEREGKELDVSLGGCWSLFPLPRSAVLLIYGARLWFQHQHCSRLLS